MGFLYNLAKKALISTAIGNNIRVESAIEWLFVPENTAGIDDDEEEKQKEKKGENKEEEEKKLVKKIRKIPVELQKLFGSLDLSEEGGISTQSLTNSFGWKSSESLQQHDVHELNRVLFEAIERSLKKTSSERLLDNLYKGTLVNKVQCLHCLNISEGTEFFQDVTTIVNNSESIVYSLEDFVKKEKLEGDNKYFCDQCKSKRDAYRWASFRETPRILQFSLLRFEYDYENDRRKKNCKKFHYPLTIDMSLYHENYNPPEAIKEEVIGGNDNGDDTKISKGESNEIQQVNSHRKKAVDLSLYEPEYNKESNELFDLFAVIIHTGTSGEYGHYHAYIKDLLHKGNWKYYKDENDYDNEVDNQFEAYIYNNKQSNHKRSASDGPKVNIDEEILQSYLLHSDKPESNIIKHHYLDESVPDNDNKSVWNPGSLSTILNPLVEVNSANTGVGSIIDQYQNEHITATVVQTSEFVPYIPTHVEKKLKKQSKKTKQTPTAELKPPKQEDTDETEGWFDFNDNTIRPIPIKTLRSQFGGTRECAYMLIYRKRTDAPLDAAEVPEFIKASIQENNKKIQSQLEEKERKLNEIRLQFYLHQHFIVNARGVAEVIQNNKCPFTRISINFDKRTTWEQLKIQVKEIFHIPSCTELEQQSNESNESNELLFEFLEFRKVSIHSNQLKSLEIIQAADTDKLSDLRLSSGNELLIWDGIHLSEHTFWDPSTEFVEFTIKILGINEKQLGYTVELTPDNIIDYLTITEHKIEFSNKSKLVDLKKHLEKITKISKEQQKISLIENSRYSPSGGYLAKHRYEVHTISPITTSPLHVELHTEDDILLERFHFEPKTELTIQRNHYHYYHSLSNDNKQEIDLTLEYIELRTNYISIIVIEKLTNKNQENILYFNELKSQKLGEMKVKVIKQLGVNYDPDHVVVRAVRMDGEPSFIMNEEVKIGGCLGDGKKVIIEPGESPNSQNIQCRCKLQFNENISMILINKSQTIAEIKYEILQTFAIDHSQFNQYVLGTLFSFYSPSYLLSHLSLSPLSFSLQFLTPPPPPPPPPLYNSIHAFSTFSCLLILPSPSFIFFNFFFISLL